MTRLRLMLGVIGVTVALVGVLRDDRRITWVALILVAAAAALKVFRRKG